uniref:Uncharacterized protein n=1 Tax=Anopheles coluzzii TaxID=1518534 RepID=A0A8W7PVS3_ANOCL
MFSARQCEEGLRASAGVPSVSVLHLKLVGRVQSQRTGEWRASNHLSSPKLELLFEFVRQERVRPVSEVCKKPVAGRRQTGVAGASVNGSGMVKFQFSFHKLAGQKVPGCKAVGSREWKRQLKPS